MSFAYSPITTSNSVTATRYAVSVSRSTNQTGLTADGAENAISFDTELFDDGGFWSAGAPTRLTVPVGAGGTYEVTVVQRYDVSSPAGWMSVGIRKNGNTSGIEALYYVDTVPQSNIYIAHSATIELADGDYIEEVASFSGGASRQAVGGQTRSNLTLERKGD